jgi:hypothetical protein
MVKKIDATLDSVYQRTPMGSVDRAMGNTFYGINHRNTSTAIQSNRDYYGLTLFTRPQLNMSTENLRSHRSFIPLLTEDQTSIQRAVRSYLDPRLAQDNIACPIVDPENIFIPLLTNHCLSVSGWPDMELQSYISKPGAYKEVFGFIDSVDDLKTGYTLSATFRNMPGSPLLLMFKTWLDYMSLVFQGLLVPYPDFMMFNELDYNTRIWRLVLDPTKTYVQHIGCCGAAYPVSWPGGRTFDYNTQTPVNDGNNELSFQFQCFGAMYDDPILVRQFNAAVAIAHTGMHEKYRVSQMQKIEYAALQIFNCNGYPRIDPDTYELEWYVRKDVYAQVVNQHNQSLRSLQGIIRA